MIALGSDHAGLPLKKEIIALLEEMHLPYHDYGTYTGDSCDYAVFAQRAAKAVVSGECERGILCCGTGIGISLAVGVLVFVLSQLFAEPILRLFKSDDAEVIRLGAKYLRAFCFDYLFVSFLFNMNSLINAAGHALFSMLSSMLSSIILRAPLAVLLSRAGLDIAVIGYAAPAATLAAILMALVYILSGKWKQNATGIHREPET